jgi:hypothetical protein
MAIFRISRSSATLTDLNNPLTVNLSVGGTAVFGVDYVVSGAASFTETAASVVIPAGMLSVAIVATAIGDLVSELSETVVLGVVREVGFYSPGVNASAVWTILNGAPVLSSLLLHFDGANGSTVITDSSASGISVGAVGCEISTEQSRFGGSSLKLFGGSNSYAEVADTPVLELGANDFTIEFWCYLITPGWVLSKTLFVPFSIFGAYSVSAIRLLFSGISAGGFLLGLNSSPPFISIVLAAVTPPMNQWSHVAITRKGSTLRYFIDGTQRSSVQSSATVNDVGVPMKIGGTDPDPGSLSTGGMIGYVDEFRMVVGTCLYDADFTPPIVPYLG